MTINTENLLADVDLPGLIQARGVPLKRNGREWRGQCPFHSGKNKEAFAVFPSKGTARWYANCFVCGWNGDAIDFVMERDGVGFRDACQLIGSGLSGGPRIEREPPPPERLTGTPGPGTPPPDMTTRKWGTPSRTWCYRDALGQPLGYVARYDYVDEDGTPRKLTPQWTWGSRDGGQTWAWGCGHWQVPRPLYGLDQLATRPTAPVLITEGEKAADAARSLLTGYVVITWPGGSSATGSADWSPLAGRDVVLWPDADEPGVKAMDAIRATLAGLSPAAQRVRWLDVSDHADGWDAADAVAEGWDTARTIAWCRERIRAPEPQPETPPVAPPEPTPPVPAATEPGDTGPEPPPEPLRARKPRLVLSRGGPEPAPEPVEPAGFLSWSDLGLDLLKGGVPLTNLDNACRVLTNHPETAGRIWADTFHHRDMMRVGDETREITDADVLRLTVWMQRDIRLRKMNRNTVEDAVQSVAAAAPKCEPLDWLNTLVWDGVARLDGFFPDYFGTPNNPYERAAGANFLRSIAARILQPGCEVQTMPILLGEQGIFKSRALRALGGDWYAKPSESIHSKDFLQNLHGVLLMEVAEMDKFNRADNSAVKSLLDTPTDRYRKSYGRRVERFPRMVVFAGTTNDDQPLRDPTGGRRFWPVRCGVILLNHLIRDRDQLFAEAVTQVRAGAHWWEMPVEDTKVAQESHRSSDEWETLIWRHIHQIEFDGVWRDRTERLVLLTTADVLQDVLSIPAGKWTLPDQNRVADILKHFKWTRVRAGRAWAFRNPEADRRPE